MEFKEKRAVSYNVAVFRNGGEIQNSTYFAVQQGAGKYVLTKEYFVGLPT